MIMIMAVTLTFALNMTRLCLTADWDIQHVPNTCTMISYQHGGKGADGHELRDDQGLQTTIHTVS